MTAQTCGDCRFYHPGRGDLSVGTCRLNPPTVLVAAGTTDRQRPVTEWPRVRSTDWCGQWEAES